MNNPKHKVGFLLFSLCFSMAKEKIIEDFLWILSNHKSLFTQT